VTKQNPAAEALDPRTNLLLVKLTPEDLAALMLHASVVTLKLTNQMLKQDALVDAVFFPLTCIFSLLVTQGGEAQMEMATIGKEGVIGAYEVFHKVGAMGLSIVQIPGTAIRIKGDAFRRWMTESPEAQQLVHRHMYALVRQILYGASCNRLHSMKERCARWLLMTQDRAGADSFPLTQEFLSHMLGVRRATVNVATGMLKKAGFIRYSRGTLTVIDRAGLESASCACYQAIRAIYAAILPE